MEQKQAALFDRVWDRLYGLSGPEGDGGDVSDVIGRMCDIVGIPEPDYAQIWDGIAPKLRKPRLWRRLRMRYAAAVAAIIMLSAGTLTLLRNTPHGCATVRPQSVTLTLSDGTCFEVDELDRYKELSGELSAVHRDSTDGLAYAVAETGAVEQEVLHTLHIPPTKDYRLTLPDGTVVWLNSDTELKFPMAFGQGERRIGLTGGEAFFEVAPDASRPFVVEAAGQTVEALGTRFNINIYPENGGAVITTLAEGSVRVSNGCDSVLLSPGQQAVGIDGDIAVSEVDIREFISWKEGMFIFNKRSLGDIICLMERWYGISVEFDDPELVELLFTGMIEKANPVEMTFGLLEKVVDVKFEKVRGKFLVRRR